MEIKHTATDAGAEAYHRYIAGEEDALGEIVRLYSDGLLCFIHGYLHDIAASEDVLSDVFLKLIVSKRRFCGESSFKTYLYAIARNKAIDCLRKRKRTVELVNIVAQTQEPCPEEVYLADERKQVLRHAIDSLSPQYRDVLYLSYFENMRNVELCKVLKKTSKQVENLLYRAKTALRTLLERNGYYYEDL